LSNAGLQKGFTDSEGNTTRSGLFFEALRIIEETRPKIAIAENVKALTSKKFEAEFTTVLGSLCRLGYNNYFNVLNAKNYGIPQNRERVFIISIRQDLDKGFCFPRPFRLDKRLKDILEVNADDKYFLSEDRVNSLLKHRERNKEKGNGFAARFVTETDIASSLTTSPDKSAGQYLQTTCFQSNVIIDDKQGVITEDLRIRKLTPLECFRLMGFDDRDLYILQMDGISDNQLYKMAGNSIVVDVLQAIFRELSKLYPDIFITYDLFKEV
jgi:DNA (cytosine-5)-methyltransferase 1